jgi:hypothetical protein
MFKIPSNSSECNYQLLRLLVISFMPFICYFLHFKAIACASLKIYFFIVFNLFMELDSVFPFEVRLYFLPFSNFQSRKCSNFSYNFSIKHFSNCNLCIFAQTNAYIQKFEFSVNTRVVAIANSCT